MKIEGHFRAIYDNSPIAIELYDSAGLLIHANPACLRLFGVENIEDITGFSLFDDPNISNDQKIMLHGGQTVRYEALFDFEKVRSMNLYPTICRGVIWLNVLITALKTNDNPLTGYLVQIQNINDRKIIEEELRKSEEKYRDLADNAPIGIITCNNEGKIIYTNRKVLEILGSPGSEKTAEINLLKSTHILKSGFADILSDVINNGISVSDFETKYVSIWGKELFIRLHVSPRFKDDRVSGARIIIDDVSDQKRTKKELNIAKKKLQLLSNITRHDILNQITVSQGFLELAREMSLDITQLVYIDKVINAISVIGRHIEFTHEYEQIVLMDPVWLSISDQIKKIDDRKLKIKYECPEISIYADPMVEKVFYNLFDNALRYADGATRIWVSSRTADSSLIIIWEDDGPGVPDDSKEQIFKRGVGKNSGLGLFLIREILEITGITITETGVYGKGARFEIIVPKMSYRIDQ